MGKQEDEARRRRLQAALRENLKRRKAQQRARGDVAPAGTEARADPDEGERREDG